MTNAPLHSRPQPPSPLFFSGKGTLASPVSPSLGRERTAVPVQVSTFTPVTGVPVRPLPAAQAAPVSAPVLAESASYSVGATPSSASFTLGFASTASAFRAVRESYAASKPTFREGVIFLSTVAVLFAFATILLDLGH